MGRMRLFWVASAIAMAFAAATQAGITSTPRYTITERALAHRRYQQVAAGITSKQRSLSRTGLGGAHPPEDPQGRSFPQH
jgi:uncharacterized protein involved in exopolysaccharide biosynthesis